MQPTHHLRAFIRLSCLPFSLAVAIVACGQEAGAGQNAGRVSSHLEGQITLSAEVDSVSDYSGFEVVIGENTTSRFDTLAYAETDAEGQFSLDVSAPRANIYTLILARGGSILRVDEIAIADGDSATFKVQFPFGNRPLMIRSRENAALMGFKNTMALHNSELNRLSQSGGIDRTAYSARIGQTAEILWNLRESNANTLAASLSSAQSILLLEGWNDSLLVVRARLIEPENPDFSAVAAAARRAELRRNGWESSVALVQEFQARATEPAVQALLQSELVLAYRDGQQIEQALDAARQLKMEYATDSTWIRWADRAMYDLEHLMPGMAAPAFRAVDRDGNPVSPERFKGKYWVLEFYVPGPEYERQLGARNAFYRADAEETLFEILSLSLQPDSLLNEAFFDGRDIPGFHVFLPDGPQSPIVEAYNVYLLPTRFLIDPEGLIAGKYVLENGTRAFQDALTFSLTASNN